MPISDIYGLRIALENVKADPKRYERHAKLGELTRGTVQEMGLSLYLEDSFSNTVTVIRVPEGRTATQILEDMKKKHNIMIAGSFDVLAGQVIRIGHMGENANEADVVETLNALREVLQ
jgi:aspartate aminotransferase-like enzyme